MNFFIKIFLDVTLHIISTSYRYLHGKHCVESVRIRSFSGPYFRACGLNTEIYGVNLRIHSEYRK